MKESFEIFSKSDRKLKLADCRKLGHTPENAKTKTITLSKFHWKENKQTDQIQTTRKIQRAECFVFPVVITVKKDISVKTALKSRDLNDSCIESRHFMQGLEKLSNQKSAQVTKIKELTSMDIEAISWIRIWLTSIVEENKQRM